MATSVWLLALAVVRRHLVGFGVLCGVAPFGNIVPTTLSAKAAWFAEQGLPATTKRHYFWLAFWNFGRQAGPLLFAAPLLLLFRVGRVALLFGLAFYGVYFYRYSSELSFYFNRYQYILIPGLLLGLVWLIARSSRLALNRLAQLEHLQYLIVLKAWDYDFGITRAFQTKGWTLKPVLTLSGPDGYNVYAMTPG